MENVVKIREDVLLLAKELDDLKGIETVVFDVTGTCSWTNYILLTTATSNAHMKGLVDQVREKIYTLDYSINQNRKKVNENGWSLLDCSDFVINVMTSESRIYFDLEDKWKDSEVIYSSSSKLS